MTFNGARENLQFREFFSIILNIKNFGIFGKFNMMGDATLQLPI